MLDFFYDISMGYESIKIHNEKCELQHHLSDTRKKKNTGKKILMICTCV